MTSQRSTLSATPPSQVISRLIEGLWLVAAGVVPLAILPEDWIVGFVQVPKVLILRTVMIALAALMVLELATRYRTWPLMDQPYGRQAKAIWSLLYDGLKERPIVLGAFGVLIATALAALLSPMPGVSIWGRDPGWDGYYLLSIASNFVVFFALATHMRTEAQLRRFLWVVVATAVALSLYGVGQFFGVDGFRNDAREEFRVSLTFGNPTFGAAYLLSTIPLTFVTWQTMRRDVSAWRRVVLGVALLAPQVFALGATASRGALGALVIAIVVTIALSVLVSQERGRVLGAIRVFGVAAAVGLFLLFIPGIEQSARVRERLSVTSAISEMVNGSSDRGQIWVNSTSLFTTVTWVDRNTFPEMPSPGNAFIRRVLGYGPDLFVHAHNLKATVNQRFPITHAHNFVLHILVELGVLGVLAYALFVAAVTTALWRLVRAAGSGTLSPAMLWVVIGLSGALVGRALEQMVGKAQIADLHIMWMLAGVVAAIHFQGIGRGASQAVDVVAPSTISRSRQRAQTARRGEASWLGWVVGSILVVGATVFWLQTVWVHVDASVLAARGLVLSEQGRPAEAAAVLAQAVDRDPQATGVTSLLAKGLIAQARAETDSSRAIEIARQAEEIIAVPISRNPLEYRARSVDASIQLTLLGLGAAPFEDAVRASIVETELRPGKVELFVDAYNLFIAVEDYESANVASRAIGRLEKDRSD